MVAPWGAAEVGDKWPEMLSVLSRQQNSDVNKANLPCDQRRHDLSERPECRLHDQDVLMCCGYELEKDGAVDRLVPSCPGTDDGTQSCDSSKGRCSSSDQASHRSHKKGGVEGQFATDEVCCHGPDGSPNYQAS